MQTPSEQRRRNVEFISAVLLAAAGLATSWSTYQASLWGGTQATKYTLASGWRVDSTQAHESADHLYTIDIATFSKWVDARAAGNTALADFYRKRFRLEFKPAFEEWLANDSPDRPNPVSTPFALPEYRLADEEKSVELTRRSAEAFKEGQIANGHSDSYVLNAVLLASVLFFAGIAQQFRVIGVQTLLLAFAGALLAVGLFGLFTLPRQ